LPVELGTPVSRPDETQKAPAPGQGAETILVVEDEDNVRALLTSMLKKQGYQVLQSPGPEEAVRICREYQRTIHLLLTDVVMPGMSGPDLADHLVLSRPEMKVMFMSGYADSAIARHRIRPDTPFIQKPFLPEALYRKLRELLDEGTPLS
jgi:hypothetical protein